MAAKVFNAEVLPSTFDYDPILIAKAAEALIKLGKADSYWLAYGALTPSGKDTVINQAGCFGSLPDLMNAAIVYSRTPNWKEKVVGKKRAIKFYDWFLNNSPWSRCLYHVGDHGNPEWALDHGIMIDARAPANLVGNACIASRTLRDIEAIKMWDEFTKASVHPNLAYVMALGLYGGEHWNPRQGPLNLSNATKEYVENFCIGKMAHPLQPFAMNPSYHPCNVVWGDEKNTSYTLNKNLGYSKYLLDTYPKPKQKVDMTISRFFVRHMLADGSGLIPPEMMRPRDWWISAGIAETKRMFGNDLELNNGKA